jgi:hypothetical protein
MTRTPSVTWSPQASPVAFPAFFSKLRELLFGFSGLASRGVRGFQVSPALDDPPVGDPPNHNSGNSSRCFDRVSVPFHRLRTTTLSSSAIMSSMVTLKSGTFLRAAPTYWIAPSGPGGSPGGTSAPWSTNSGAKFTSPMPRFLRFTNSSKMIANEFLHLQVRHAGLGILDFRCSRSCIHSDLPFQADAA